MKMTTRKVRVVSTRLNKPVEFESSAKNRGELNKDLSKAGVDYSGMTVMVKQTRCELNLEEAVLPEGDFTILVLAKKMKSGATAKKEKTAAKKPVKKTAAKPTVKKAVKKVTKKAAPKPVAKKATKKAPAEEVDDFDDELKEAKRLEKALQSR